MVNLQDYIVDSRLFKTFKVDELLFVKYQCLVEDDRSEIWTHHNYFAYAHQGKKKWKTHKNEYLLTSGEALFVKKGATAVYQYFEDQFFVIFVFMPDNFIRKTLLKYSNAIPGKKKKYAPGDTVIPLHMDEILQSFFQSLLAFFMQAKPPAEELLRLKMEELILSIFSHSKNNPLKEYFLNLGNTQKVSIEEVMESHFSNPLSIVDYARLCSRSLSAFRRDFKKIYNVPPGKWLMNKRLEFSRFLLETSDKTINEIFEESGFKNRSHFISVFKQAYGMTPKRFQKRHSFK